VIQCGRVASLPTHGSQEKENGAHAVRRAPHSGKQVQLMVRVKLLEDVMLGVAESVPVRVIV
jgi:hypothetical protein